MKSERIRQIVLEQMGISPWFPRAHLPAAAPSHPQTRRALREAVHSRADTLREGGPGAVPDVAGPVQPDTTDSTAPGRTSTLQRLLQDAPAAPATEPATESATEKALRSVTNDPIAPVVASLATTEAISFAFCWVDLDEHLAVLAELPANSRRLSREARQMLGNITAALNPRYRMATLREHNFHWPFVVAPDLPADAQAAQQAVDGFISRRLQDRKVSHVLVLSDSMPFYLSAGLDNDPTALHRHARYGFRLLQTHALHAMLSDAALKRSAWQTMRTLVSALHNTPDGI